jgi:DNA-directed RNA polymerase subunit RPC12/RpoP
MDTEKSKPILIGLAVVCLAGAGILLYVNMGGSSGGGSGEPIPMICVACGHTYELPVRQFQDMMAQQGPDMMMDPMATPRLDCPSCHQKGAQSGIKCSGCDSIFFADYMRNPELKCPQCGKSNL